MKPIIDIKIRNNLLFLNYTQKPNNIYKYVAARGYDSVIRRMKILVCSSIDYMCVFSTFALELEDK